MKRLMAATLLMGSVALTAEPLFVNGAGATFPLPLYLWWFSDYYKLHPEVRFNYQPVGSWRGIQRFLAGGVDFGASDVPLDEAQIVKAGDVVHLPMAVGAVAIPFNVRVERLRLTPTLLADIFLGKIKKWSDPAIARVNPGVGLPYAPIVVVHREEGSGSSLVFTDYLSKVSPEWKAKVGSALAVKWPTGSGATGSAAVAELIRRTPGAIGYLELSYANRYQIATAELQNKDGYFVKANASSITEAASRVSVPPDFRASLTHAPGPNAWPIASFTYLLVRREMRDAARGQALVGFIWWAIHTGQAKAELLDYAPLPQTVAERLAKTIAGLRIDGKPPRLPPIE